VKRRGLRPIAIAIAATGIASVAVAFLLFCLWIGYFAHSPFTLVRPTETARRDATVIFLSGDIGFRLGMAPQIAERLTADGYPVVGINSLTYFRTTRTAAEATALIEDAIAQAHTLSHGGRLILIGQSYGADMLHVGLVGLPDALRREIAMVALIVPGATVEYRASPGEVLTFAMAEEDAMPSARQLDWVPLLCLWGREEAASLCPLLHLRNLHSVGMPGGHPLHYDADAVYRQITVQMARVGLGHVQKQ
jgi:type IV secretory pathway VirJ component